MWIATQHGFYSIVRKDDELYFIRARERHDLENLKALADLEAEVHEWPSADYRYRIMVDMESLLEVMVRLTTALDYPNFKARVYEQEDQVRKLGPYQHIWKIMADLQSGEEPVWRP